MGASIEFIKDRAVKTISAAKQLSPGWVWQEKPIADLEAQLAAIAGDKNATPPVIGQEELLSATKQVMLNKRGVWDSNLDQLHRWTMQGVGMAKSKFRNNAATLSQLDALTARGTSRSETLDEALAWESAWANVDAAWAPMPANTLGAFKALRKSCNEEFKTDYSDARADWREDAEKLSQLGRDMDDVDVAWYADATRAFPEGTPEGDMIRGTVPTTYVPQAATKPAPASPAAPVA